MTPIPISPLQLKSHFFHVIRLRAVPGGKKEGQTTFNREVAFSPLPDKPKEWQLELNIKLECVDKTNPFIYEFEIHVIGFFELVVDLPEDRRQQIIVVNGLSILYGALREMVINLTSRSAFGPLSLPSISFADVLNEVKSASNPAPPESLPPADKK
jgi:preprotein translocase subunit SecB